MKKYWVNRDYLSDIPPEWRAKKLGCFVYKAIDVAELARKALEGIDDYWCTLPENQAFMAELDALAGEGG